MWCFSSLHLLLVCIFHLISAERSYHFLYFNSTWYLSALMWCVLSIFLNKEHQLDRVRNSVQWFCDSLLLQWVVVYVPLPRKIKTKKLRKCKKIEKKEKTDLSFTPTKRTEENELRKYIDQISNQKRYGKINQMYRLLLPTINKG